jgi:hypothetical protein
MWWEPAGGDKERYEYKLAEDVRRLRAWYSEQPKGSPTAWGVGSGWSKYFRRLCPLILLNASEFKGCTTAAGVMIRLHHKGYFPKLNLALHYAITHRPQPTALLETDRPDLRESLIDRYIRVREPIVSGPNFHPGTASVLVWDENIGEHCLLTAGHVVPGGHGTSVDKVDSMFWIMTRRRRLGTVTHHIEPPGGVAGWDAAVIKLKNAFKYSGAFVTQCMRRFSDPTPVTVYGARSGVVSKCAVQGALTDLGQWKNCWMVAPSGVLKAGDSGSAIFTSHDRSLLGMYVARSRMEDTDRSLFHYVQDAYTLEREVLTDWNVRFVK